MSRKGDVTIVIESEQTVKMSVCCSGRRVKNITHCLQPHDVTTGHGKYLEQFWDVGLL